jgi:hypothetical protein
MEELIISAVTKAVRIPTQEINTQCNLNDNNSNYSTAQESNNTTSTLTDKVDNLTEIVLLLTKDLKELKADRERERETSKRIRSPFPTPPKNTNIEQESDEPSNKSPPSKQQRSRSDPSIPPRHPIQQLTDQSISPDNTNHNGRLLRTQKQFTQIKLNTSQTDNLPFGDDISEPHGGETIIFHNINGIKDMTNWFQILMTMTELNIDIFGFAEINQKMDNGEKYQWTDQIRKHF